jgi:hypothetical protein
MTLVWQLAGRLELTCVTEVMLKDAKQRCKSHALIIAEIIIKEMKTNSL